MALTIKEIRIIQTMYMDHSWPKDMTYLDNIRTSDTFARTEISAYVAKRLAEITVDEATLTDRVQTTAALRTLLT